ncbi:MAG: NUDIX domain-containing protein [Candidatus Levybacteria bacterium]|nr:NUDIX domain-containing protein [Candidatus Levybacteria bacterium]
MDDKILQSLILLTYKGKALLMRKKDSPMDKEKHPWCFIGGIKEKKESLENTMTRQVEKEMGIKIGKVEFVSESCYHARLTDDNVNRIERSENQLFNFFSLRELKKLFLSSATAQFISKHGALV